jgi:hypothetical protein
MTPGEGQDYEAVTALPLLDFVRIALSYLECRIMPDFLVAVQLCQKKGSPRVKREIRLTAQKHGSVNYEVNKYTFYVSR